MTLDDAISAVRLHIQSGHRLRDFEPELRLLLAAASARKDMEQAVLSGASSIIDNWEDWDAEAQQAAQQDQDDRAWRHVLLTHIVSRLWREFGWPMREQT